MLLETNYISYFTPSFNQLCSDWLHIARRRWLGHLCSYTKKPVNVELYTDRPHYLKPRPCITGPFLNTTAFMSKLQNWTNLVRKLDRHVCLMCRLSLSLQLNQVAEDPLKRPVVYVKGNDAVKLMNIVNKQKVARARIQHRPPRVSAYSQKKPSKSPSVDGAHVCGTNLGRTRETWGWGERVCEAHAAKQRREALDVKTNENSSCEIWPLFLSSLLFAAPRPKTFSQRFERLISAVQRAVCLLGIFDKRPAHFEVK